MDVENVGLILKIIKWIKLKIKNRKKDVKIAVLEEKIKEMSNGNQMLIDNVVRIILSVLDKIKPEDDGYNKTETIINVIDNKGPVCMSKDIKIEMTDIKTESQKVDSIFDGIDEEITKCRLTRPSEREM